MSKWVISLIFALSFSLLIASGCAPTGGVKPADFFEANVIDFSSTSREGSSVDLTARLYAPLLQKHMGAAGAVVTTRRAAGGLEGYNFVYRAEPDGLHIGNGLSISPALNQIMGNAAVDYEADKFTFLHGVAREYQTLFVKADGPYQSIADLQAGKNMKIPATSPSGGFALGAVTAIFLLDLDAKVVPGLKSPAACQLSVIQGESAAHASVAPVALEAVRSGQLKPLFVIGPERDTTLPDVPAITELITFTGEKAELIETWGHMGQIRTVFGPPGIPKDRLDFLQKAFAEISKDPEFIQGMQKILGYQGAPILTGEEVLKDTKALIDNKEQIRAAFEDLFRRFRA